MLIFIFQHTFATTPEITETIARAFIQLGKYDDALKFFSREVSFYISIHVYFSAHKKRWLLFFFSQFLIRILRRMPSLRSCYYSELRTSTSANTLVCYFWPCFFMRLFFVLGFNNSFLRLFKGCFCLFCV